MVMMGHPDATTEVLGLLEPDGKFHPGLLEKAYEQAGEPRYRKGKNGQNRGGVYLIKKSRRNKLWQVTGASELGDGAL